jgi:hypothetical protein
MRPRPIAWSRPRTAALSFVIAAAGALATLVANTPSAHAAEFDAATGTLRASRDALCSYRFETAQELIDAKLQIAKWGTSTGGFPPLTATPATTDALAPLLQGADASGVSDAIEGSGYLRLALPSGVAVVDEAFFASIASRRVEVTLWARAEGSAPQLRVLYGGSDLSSAFQHAQVQAIRTGRETTDGWAEYTTGPVDGMVWGAAIKAIVVTGSPFGGKGPKASIDMLEIRPAPGSNQPVTACTQADVDGTCGAGGECLYGRCVPSSVVWGPLPTQAHREQLVERWIQIAGRFLGDRAASKTGRTTFAASARDLARYSVSSRQFFGGLTRLVNLLRDNHTSFGAPPASFTFFGPGLQGGWSAGLDACFGVVEKDLLGGGRGFGVFQAGTAPATGVALKVGDVVTKIDGLDPKAWVDAVYPRVAAEMPNDPDADWSWAATDLAAMITARAKNLTVTRCASATACAGADRKELTIDVGDTLFQQETTGGLHVTDYSICSPRFHDSVDTLTDSTQGENPIDVQTKAGVVYAQFDGFVGIPQNLATDPADPWKVSMQSLFEAKPAKVVMDARQGYGGYSDNIQLLLDLTRGTAEPIGAFDVIRGGWDDADPTGVFAAFEKCDGNSSSIACVLGTADVMFTSQVAPPGAASKIAWLNTADVSANDYAPRLLKGRTNLRVFGPTNTSGAYGAITYLPTLIPGWMGGSVQYTDTRFGATLADVPGARWESSHGVAPDVVVAQTVSDLLSNRDTILEAANKWLAE